MQHWFSSPFYTNTRGYTDTQCLRVDAGGIGEYKDTQCPMVLYLMQGDYDDVISWPVKIKLQIRLLNQII